MTNISWEGTFQIWQNEEFGNIYSKGVKEELISIDNIQVYISKKIIIGYATLYCFASYLTTQSVLELISIAEKKNIAKINIYCINRLSEFENFFRKESNTIVLNLGESEEFFWKKIGDKTRNMIRKSMKNKVTVSLAQEENEFFDWWELYSFRSKIKKFKKQSQNLIEELYKNRRLSRLYVTKYNNKIIGGSFFLVDKYPMYWLGAYNKSYNKFASGHINIWEAINCFRLEGYSLMDLGGISTINIDGPSLFKKSFRGEVKQGYIYEIITNRPKQVLIDIIKKMKFL